MPDPRDLIGRRRPNALFGHRPVSAVSPNLSPLAGPPTHESLPSGPSVARPVPADWPVPRVQAPEDGFLVGPWWGRHGTTSLDRDTQGQMTGYAIRLLEPWTVEAGHQYASLGELRYTWAAKTGFLGWGPEATPPGKELELAPAEQAPWHRADLTHAPPSGEWLLPAGLIVVPMERILLFDRGTQSFDWMLALIWAPDASGHPRGPWVVPVPRDACPAHEDATIDLVADPRWAEELVRWVPEVVASHASVARPWLDERTSLEQIRHVWGVLLRHPSPSVRLAILQSLMPFDFGNAAVTVPPTPPFARERLTKLFGA